MLLEGLELLDLLFGELVVGLEFKELLVELLGFFEGDVLGLLFLLCNRCCLRSRRFSYRSGLRSFDSLLFLLLQLLLFLLRHHLFHLSYLLLINLLLLQLLLILIILKLRLLSLNVHHRLLRLILLLLQILVHRLILYLVLLLRNRTLRELDLAIYLHIIVFLLVLLPLVEQVLQLPLEQLPLVIREVLRILLVLRVELLEDLILLLFGEVFVGFAVEFVVFCFVVEGFSAALFLFWEQRLVENVGLFRFSVDALFGRFLLDFSIGFEWVLVFYLWLVNVIVNDNLLLLRLRFTVEVRQLLFLVRLYFWRGRVFIRRNFLFFLLSFSLFLGNMHNYL